MTCTTAGSFYVLCDLRVGSWLYALGQENVQRVDGGDGEGDGG